MFSILSITIGVIIFVLLAIVIVWRWTYGSMFRAAIFKFFSLLFGGGSEVDANAPIYPSQDPPISDFMREKAEMHKDGIAVSAPINSQVPQANIPAPSSAVKPNYEPPYTQNPVTIIEDPVTVTQPDNTIASPVQPLVEDITFNRDDPIIDQQHIDPETPSADTLDSNDTVLGKIAKSNKSDFGVRYADHSPGRVIRDKRSSRNSS